MRQLQDYPSPLLAPPALQYKDWKYVIGRLAKFWRKPQHSETLDTTVQQYGTIVFDKSNEVACNRTAVIFKQNHLSRYFVDALLRDQKFFQLFLRHHNEVRGCQWSLEQQYSESFFVFPEAFPGDPSEKPEELRKYCTTLTARERLEILLHPSEKTLRTSLTAAWKDAKPELHDVLLAIINGGQRQAAAMLTGNRPHTVHGAHPPQYETSENAIFLANEAPDAFLRLHALPGTPQVLEELRLMTEKYRRVLLEDRKFRHGYIADVIAERLPRHAGQHSIAALTLGSAHSKTEKIEGNSLMPTTDSIEEVLLERIPGVRVMTVATTSLPLLEAHAKLHTKQMEKAARSRRKN